MRATEGSGLRTVARWSLAMGASVVIGLAPGVGDVLSFFALPILCFAVAFHGLLVSLGWQALGGRIALCWAAVPLVWYAGGAGLHLASIGRAHAIASRMNAVNMSQRARVATPFSYRADDGMAVGDTTLAERYRVAAAFLVGRNDTTIRYVAYGDACASANQGFWYAKRFEPWVYRRDLFPNYRGSGKTVQCMLSKDGASTDTPYRIVNRQSAWAGDWLNGFRGEDWTVWDDGAGRRLAAVRTGSVTEFPWIAIPWAACGLVSPSSSLHACRDGMAGLFHGGSVPVGYRRRTDGANPFSPPTDPESTRVAAVAHALELQPRLPTD